MPKTRKAESLENKNMDNEGKGNDQMESLMKMMIELTNKVGTLKDEVLSEVQRQIAEVKLGDNSTK